MFKDSLQKKLQEMEKESPSFNLEIGKPTLRKRIGFLERYFSRAVEQVPQKSSIHDLLNDKSNYYNPVIEYQGYRGEIGYWVNATFDEAINRKKLNNIETSLRITNKKEDFTEAISTKLIQKLENLYSEGIKIKGLRYANHWVNTAFDEARMGARWSNIQTSLGIARDYAKEAGIEFDIDMETLKITYEKNIKKFGPSHAEYWRKIAKKELAQGKPQDEINTSLKIARDYAKEAGIRFEN